jgi:hypothetical protein
MPQLEFGQLYKFIVSLGFVLMAAAFIGPWAILREQGALVISERELAGLTPLAREVLEAKQAQASRIVECYPWVALMLFLTGALLAAWGLWRWKARQRVADEREDVGLATERLKLEPMTDDETARRLDEEVAAAQDESSDAGSPIPPTDAGQVEPGRSSSTPRDQSDEDPAARRQRLRLRYEQVESLANSRIQAAFGSDRRVHTDVKVVGADGRSVGQADVVALAPSTSAEPSLVFEIKLATPQSAARQTESALLSAARFAVALRPAAAAGVALLVVSTEEEQRRARSAVERTLGQLQAVLNARIGAVVLTNDELESVDPAVLRAHILGAIGGP